MSIKPIDFQVMMPRTIDAAKATNDLVQRNILNQQQQASVTRQKSEDELRQVYSRDQAQNVVISEKQREKQEKGENKDKSEEKSDEKQENATNKLNNTLNTSTIDIKI